MEMIKEPEFWVAVSFVLFIGVLLYVGAHKKITDAHDHRSARIKAELDEAGRLRDEAGKLLAEYQRKQREAESEAEAIIADARAEAERVAAEARVKMEEFVARRTKLAEANRLKEQSDAALKSYEKSLADARGRAQALANETRDKLGAEAEARRKALEGQLNLKLTEAEKTIATTKTAAMTNVRGIAVDTATAIVERLIGSAPSGSAVEAAVADALKR